MKHPTIRTNELPTRPESHCEETPSYQKESGIGIPQRPSAPSAVNNSWVAGEARAASNSEAIY
jgi:hypothetical protein